MNKHNQKSTDIFNKHDLTGCLTCIKILKDLNILNFWLHISEAIFKVLQYYNTISCSPYYYNIIIPYQSIRI